MNAKTLDEEQYMFWSTSTYEHNFLLIIIFISSLPCLLSRAGAGVPEWSHHRWDLWMLTMHRAHQAGCAEPSESYKEINDPAQWQWALPPPIPITTCYQPLHGKKNLSESEGLNKCNKMKLLSSRGTNSRSSWFPAGHTQCSWDSIASLGLQSCIHCSTGARGKDGREVGKRKRKKKVKGE